MTSPETERVFEWGLNERVIVKQGDGIAINPELLAKIQAEIKNGLKMDFIAPSGQHVSAAALLVIKEWRTDFSGKELADAVNLVQACAKAYQRNPL